MIQVGSDADLTIVDMEKEQKFTKDMVHSKSGWTLFDGDTFTGWPVQTIVRGKTVMIDGEITRGGPDRVTAHRGKGPN
jgi:dihydroorotase-like cyclic amidohydrolase